MTNKFLLALHSRTVWTIVLIFLVNGISGIRGLLPAASLPIVDAILGLVAIYFRVNPKAM
jgi:hypothetical protein